MFEYAAACSLHNGSPVALRDRKDNRAVDVLKRYPELFGNICIVDDVPAGINVWKEKRVPFDKIIVDGSDILLDGVFFSEKYFDELLVRKMYRPSSSVRSELFGKYGDWLSRPNVTSIHVRRGDYIKCMYDFPFAGRNYYRSALRRLPECRDFIICSDDILWCKRFFPKTFPDKHFCFAEGNTPLQDIYLQSFCKNNIMSNGSFAWWGAYLNEHKEKRVFAPSMWFGFAVPPRVSPIDIYFKGTEVVENHYDFNDWLYAHWRAYFLRFRKWVNPVTRAVRKCMRRGER